MEEKKKSGMHPDGTEKPYCINRNCKSNKTGWCMGKVCEKQILGGEQAKPTPEPTPEKAPHVEGFDM